jgi:putative ABC transport system permease protein
MFSAVIFLDRFPGMSSVLALRNLVHDQVRLVVTVIGIVFAVVLINVQLGLFLGFARTTSSLVDHAGADLWVMAKGTMNVDQSVAISERKVFQAMAVPGVKDAARLNTEFTYFKKPDGGTESVIVVGFDPAQGIGGPWNVVEGDVKSLNFAGAVMVDEFYKEKLGITHLGQIVEIGERQAKIVGFTRGIRSFTQSPYIFASTKTALDYSRIRSDQTKYVLCRLIDGADIDAVKAALSERFSDAEVLTAAQFAYRTQVYWMFTTGAGLALLVAAAMGLAVGVVVVSQTLYATTIAHLQEFGTLRAIGAPAKFIYGVIIRQAVLSAIAGYALGLLVTLAIIAASRNLGPTILLTPELAVAVFCLTIAMCVGAATISIRKVTHLDPSMVFK